MKERRPQVVCSGWERLEPLLGDVQRPVRYVDREWGAVHDESAEYRAVLVYPDTYEIGMANQALAILYERMNALEGVYAERAYVPWIDLGDAMRDAGVPLCSLESGFPLADADLIGITLPYELAYLNVLEALDLSGIPIRARDRVDGDPVVLGGGPCAYNPEPVAPFFDAILVGEGEEAIGDIIRVHRAARVKGATRAQTLRELADVGGVYVPSLYETALGRESTSVTEGADGAPVPVVKRVLNDLDTFRSPICPVVPYMDVVHDRSTVEVLRGCTRGCRFCQAGMVYRPVRERPADSVVRDAIAALRCTGHDEVSLASLSTTDHSELEEILRRLVQRLAGSDVSVSLPSLRVDAFSVRMARLASSGRKSGLTFAPEAGTQRLRDVINKNVTEEDLLETVRRAFENGWKRAKLYFMVGLPTETDQDVQGIGELTSRVLAVARDSVPPANRGAIRIAVSVSTFVPKAHTPFQWEGQIPVDEILRRQAVLRESMPRKGVELSWHDAEVSFLEAVLARGGREVADALELAFRDGARFHTWTERFDARAWSRAFAAANVDAGAIAGRARSASESMPWDHLSCGVSRSFLVRERERAEAGETTPDCSFDGCVGCDVCGDLGIDIVVGGHCGGR